MPASPSTARAINDRLALRLLQQEGPLTAGQLKQLTGLSRPTVADLVERLTASGLITVVGESGEVRRGPNARLYGIVADRAHLAALDVRTGGVLVLISDLVGRVLAEASVPIGGDSGTGPAVEQAVAAVERTAKEAGADPLHTVGIGAPGLVDPATGDLRDSAGLPAWHRSLAAALQERLQGARVTVENETNLAALAEQREGAARDRDTFVLLWLGHGVGAAVVLDGTLRRGASGGTGEIGFLPVPGTRTLPSATDCGGGFHSLVGAAAIGALAADFGLPVPGPPGGPGAAEVVRAAVQEAAARGTVPAVVHAGGERTSAKAGSSHLTAEPAEAAAGTEDVTARADLDTGGAGGVGPPARPAGGTPADTASPADPGGGMARGVAATAVSGAGGVGPVSGSADLGAVGGATADRGVGGVGPVSGSAGLGVVGGATADRRAVAPDGTYAPVGPGAGGPGRVAGSADAGPAGFEGGGTGPGAGGATCAAAPAVRFLEALADRVAVGAASVAAILDPGCVVLGGEVGQAGGAVLAGMVEERLRRMSPLATEVRASSLGGAAVLRGALLTARDRAQDELFAPPER
jgi:predicted NBD/HSP70 family sugar kinase